MLMIRAPLSLVTDGNAMSLSCSSPSGTARTIADLNIVCNTVHAYSVIPGSGNDTGAMCAMEWVEAMISLLP